VIADPARPDPEQPDAPAVVVVGYVSGVFGTRGWLKVHSYTRPRTNLLGYPDWLVGTASRWIPFNLLDGKVRGPALVVELHGITSREQAAELVRAEIAITRAALPDLAKDEYYWADLIGMHVCNREGVDLGRVVRLVEAGDHDVIVCHAARDYLIPFVRKRYVLEVDRAAGSILVDWHVDD